MGGYLLMKSFHGSLERSRKTLDGPLASMEGERTHTRVMRLNTRAASGRKRKFDHGVTGCAMCKGNLQRGK